MKKYINFINRHNFNGDLSLSWVENWQNWKLEIKYHCYFPISLQNWQKWKLEVNYCYYFPVSLQNAHYDIFLFDGI